MRQRLAAEGNSVVGLWARFFGEGLMTISSREKVLKK